MKKEPGYGLVIHPDFGRIGRFWWVNADTRPWTIKELNTKFFHWGSCGWGDEIVYRFVILGEITDAVRKYFNDRINNINEKLQRHE